MKFPDDIQIVIPSYERHDTIERKTLAFLDRMKVDPKHVYIYVQSSRQQGKYAVGLSKRWAARVFNMNVEVGVNHARNWIQLHSKRGAKLVFMDDDVRNLVVKNPGTTMKTPRKEQGHFIEPKEFRTLCRLGFQLCDQHDKYLWGVYTSNNPSFMRERVFIGLTYVIGAFFGMVVRHDKDTLTKHSVKEDHERTLRYFTKDGGVIKMEHVGIDTSYFGGHGGIHAKGYEERRVRMGEAIDSLLKEFPGICSERAPRQYKTESLQRRDITLKRIHHLL